MAKEPAGTRGCHSWHPSCSSPGKSCPLAPQPDAVLAGVKIHFHPDSPCCLHICRGWKQQVFPGQVGINLNMARGCTLPSLSRCSPVGILGSSTYCQGISPHVQDRLVGGPVLSWRVQDERSKTLEAGTQISWGPVGLEGSCVLAQPEPKATDSRKYIFSASFLMTLGCPSETTLQYPLSLQVEDMQMQQLRKGEHSTHHFAPTFFLAHLYQSSSTQFPLAGVVWVMAKREFWQ